MDTVEQFVRREINSDETQAPVRLQARVAGPQMTVNGKTDLGERTRALVLTLWTTAVLTTAGDDHPFNP
jgi:hypothetical protein